MGLRNWIYRNYKYRVFPRVKHIRGATRLKQILDRLTLIEVEKYDDEPTGIADLEWNNLIVLDGCRHDLYEEVNGPTEKRVTLGSNTKEFLKKNFSDGDWSDVVYVTANPHLAPHLFEDITGRDVEETFKEVYHAYMDRWSDEHNTVLPEDLVDAAEEAIEDHPDARLIVHFMQPHYPFIDGKTTTEGIRPDLDHDQEGYSAWNYAELGEYDYETVWHDYRKNLETVLSCIEGTLLPRLDGRTIVTSDHGNLVGENNRFGHPADSNVKWLREVPYEVRGSR